MLADAFKVKLASEYALDSVRNLMKNLLRQDHQIVFNLADDYHDDNDSARHFYLTLNFFNKMGFTIYLYRNITLYGYRRMGRYGRLIYSIHNLKIINKIPKNTHEMFCTFDTANPELLKMNWKKLIYINILKPIDFRYGQVLWIPYFLHPFMYKSGQDEQVHELRKLPKTLRIFFAGNTVSGYYDNSNLRLYNQMTRREAIDAILGKVEGVSEIQDIDTFLNRLKQGEKIRECLLLLLKANKISGMSPMTYMESIARSEFFLCLSGTDLPMCHNTIEAMALGTIPIISYPDWFFPHLEHMKNAIIYSGKEDLAQKIKDVLVLPEEKVKEMSRNVADYYDHYLRPQRVLRDLQANKDKICTLMACPKLVCTPEQSKKEFPIKEALERELGKLGNLNKTSDLRIEYAEHA